ncbi:hypothetical protein C9413_29070 [Rhizobium sp. SEMIA 4085]|uniref:MoaF-like domain-containing protein n=1 Tax=Rhizobium gallicum bv. gallicum R602sp TaxID=1041138 RepID=A0A0B4X362_9HYPH|nr:MULTISPECIES: hypothetical protein [Rhizobium]AJD42559.1 hypothetical protein RGR602_CH03243 [Rhizobium gallicum bv. gallicum R602sp]NNH33320.1 hypothetical protein [Rhizobium sp. SEMIA 4085]
MSVEHFPIGQEMDVAYPNFKVSQTLLSVTQLRFEIREGLFARTETVDYGATVTNVQDYDRGLVHSFATLPDGKFLRMTGPIVVTRPADRVPDDRPERATRRWCSGR